MFSIYLRGSSGPSQGTGDLVLAYQYVGGVIGAPLILLLTVVGHYATG